MYIHAWNFQARVISESDRLCKTSLFWHWFRNRSWKQVGQSRQEDHEWCQTNNLWREGERKLWEEKVRDLEGHFLIKNLPKQLNPKDPPFGLSQFPSTSKACFCANNMQGSFQPLRHVVPGKAKQIFVMYWHPGMEHSMSKHNKDIW